MLVKKHTLIIFLTTSAYVCAPSPTDPPQQDICYVKVGV